MATAVGALVDLQVTQYSPSSWSKPEYERNPRCAELPAVTLSGITGASARRTRSTARWTWQKRAKHARGKRGLKIDPSGATTCTGLSMPSFCGTNTGYATSSRKIILEMSVMADTVVPSNGQL
jgi:hypothetical protein